MKTSDQPSFTSAEALHTSDTSPVPSLNLQPKWWNSKEITSSSYRNLVGVTQKKKIKQATESKTNWLASNTLLGPSKRQKRVVCRDPTPSDTPSDSDTDLTVPFADDLTEEEQDADCVFCTGHFSDNHNVEE